MKNFQKQTILNFLTAYFFLSNVLKSCTILSHLTWNVCPCCTNYLPVDCFCNHISWPGVSRPIHPPKSKQLRGLCEEDLQRRKESPIQLL